MSKPNGVVSLATISLLAIFFAGQALVASSVAEIPLAPGPSGYHVAKTIPIGGEGGWDYATTDSMGRRIYVSHGTHVVVLDADTLEKVGDIPDTQGVHGI